MADVIYWCAKCKHAVPDYIREKGTCDICKSRTVKIKKRDKKEAL